jgi:hypothetical protein
MGTHDPMDFSFIRWRVLIGFCTHGSISGANLIPGGFAGLGLIGTRGTQAEIKIYQ